MLEGKLHGGFITLRTPDLSTTEGPISGVGGIWTWVQDLINPPLLTLNQLLHSVKGEFLQWLTPQTKALTPGYHTPDLMMFARWGEDWFANLHESRAFRSPPFMAWHNVFKVCFYCRKGDTELLDSCWDSQMFCRHSHSLKWTVMRSCPHSQMWFKICIFVEWWYVILSYLCLLGEAKIISTAASKNEISSATMALKVDTPCVSLNRRNNLTPHFSWFYV